MPNPTRRGTFITRGLLDSGLIAPITWVRKAPGRVKVANWQIFHQKLLNSAI